MTAEGLTINGVVPGAGKCVACHDAIPDGRLMCAAHWRRVPQPHRAAINTALRLFNRGDGTLAALRDAQWAALHAVEAAAPRSRGRAVGA